MDATMRVAHIGWVASCHLVRRVDELTRRGVEGVVFTDNIPSHFDPDAHNFDLIGLPKELFDTPLELVHWIEECIQELNIDLLHAHSSHFPASLAYFVRTVPVVNSPWDFVNSKDPFSPLFNQAILDELSQGRLADAVSFSSKPYMDTMVGKGLSPERAFWHSWGVDLDTFVPGKYAKAAAQLRSHLGIAPDEIVLLSPRTPSLPANADIAMQAVAELAKTHPVKLIVTGHHITRESGYYERLAARPDIAAATIFIDTLRKDTDIATLYEAADIVLSIHSNDFNPATILEAFAMERPVLYHDLPTVSFWARDRVNGRAVAQRDVPDTVAVLNETLHMSKTGWRAMGQSGRELVLAHADFRKTMDTLPDDYRSILRAAALSPSPKMTMYDKGLLHDICGCPKEALSWYRQAESLNEQRSLLPELLEEKTAILQEDKGVDYFCTKRCQPIVRQMAKSDPASWDGLAAQLPIPLSLFRHDFIAGLLPLLLKEDFETAYALICCLAERFSTDTPEWVGESVVLFGRRFGMWKECEGLLEEADIQCAALAPLADEIEKALQNSKSQTNRPTPLSSLSGRITSTSITK